MVALLKPQAHPQARKVGSAHRYMKDMGHTGSLPSPSYTNVWQGSSGHWGPGNTQASKEILKVGPSWPLCSCRKALLVPGLFSSGPSAGPSFVFI